MICDYQSKVACLKVYLLNLYGPFDYLISVTFTIILLDLKKWMMLYFYLLRHTFISKMKMNDLTFFWCMICHLAQTFNFYWSKLTSLSSIFISLLKYIVNTVFIFIYIHDLILYNWYWLWYLLFDVQGVLNKCYHIWKSCKLL